MAAVIGRGITKGIGGGDQGCFHSPFIAYHIVVISLNTVAIVGGVISQFDLHKSQRQWYGYDRCDGWLFMNGFFGVLHILGSMYIVRKIREPEDAIEVNHVITTADYQLHQQPSPAKIKKKEQAPRLSLWGGAKVTPIQEPIPAVLVQKDPEWMPHPQETLTPVISPYAQKSMGPADSWVRIRHVLMENYLVALYFLIYLFYLAWHYFDTNFYPCNRGMAFVQRTADIFIFAAPCAFAFSVITMMIQKRQL